MSPDAAERLKASAELVKSGYENAQARIAFLDSKIGVVSAFLLLIVPSPWVMLGWVAGRDEKMWAEIVTLLTTCSFPAVVGVLALLSGSVLGVMALLHAIDCAQPRGPQAGTGSQFRPNVVFPMVPAAQTNELEEHLRQLGPALGEQFPLDQYKEQLVQVGWILDAKMAAMKRCFTMTRLAVLFSFAGAVVFLLYLVIGLSR